MKHRITASLHFDMEMDVHAPSTYHQQARKIVEDSLGAEASKYTIHIQIDKLKEAQQKIRLATFRPEEVLQHATRKDQFKEYQVNGQTYQVKMKSQRYFIFRQSRHCCVCGIEGTQMILEKNPADKHPHFNLYAEFNGELVLMTKDHIEARSNGGKNDHSNYQTMCATCNTLKGSCRLTLEGILQLRQVYDANKDVLPKAQLLKVMKEARASAPRYAKPKKIKHTGPYANHDLNVYLHDDGEREALHAYADQPECSTFIACIRQGTPLDYADGRITMADGAFCTIHPRLLEIPQSSSSSSTV
jgi:hypothetical protein